VLRTNQQTLVCVCKYIYMYICVCVCVCVCVSDFVRKIFYLLLGELCANIYLKNLKWEIKDGRSIFTGTIKHLC